MLARRSSQVPAAIARGVATLLLALLAGSAAARESAARVDAASEFSVDLRRPGPTLNLELLGNASRLPALLAVNSGALLSSGPRSGPGPDFFRNRYPQYRQFRVGNLFFGYQCSGMDFDELAVRASDGRIEYRFGQTLDMLQTLVAAGIKPHLALTGTPRALVPPGEKPLEHPAYGCVNAPAIDWSKTQPRERMPEWWALQDAFFKALVARFGKAELQGWTFATWTEPLNPTRKLAHLVLPEAVVRDGRHDEAVATLLATSIDAAMTHGLRIRLGNMAGPVDKEYPKLVREIGRFARGKDYLGYIEGYAISRYRTKAGQDIGQQLDAAFALLSNPAMPDKPLFIDELGDLAGDDGVEPFAGAAGLDGARFVATALERVVARQDGTPRSPRSVALWSDQITPRPRHLFTQPEAYLRSAASHVTNMFASLRGHARLVVDGPARLAVAGTREGRVKLILLGAPMTAGLGSPQPQTRGFELKGLRPNAAYSVTLTEVSRLQGNPISAFLGGAPGQGQDRSGRFEVRGGEWKLASPYWESCYFDEDARCAWRESARRIEAPLVRSSTLRSDAAGTLRSSTTVDAPAIVMIDVAPAP
ncbi:MAG TPA: hypothetical protein VLI72_01815 [Methylibium sp.]|nr:hypothetical protein [Methylibium sp.]